MKKCYIVLCAISIFAVLVGVSGCQTEKLEKYQSFVADISNDGTGIEAERSYWTGVYERKENMEQVCRTVYYNNIQFTGTYKKSITRKLNSYTTDIYCTQDGIDFGLHEETGALVSINFMNKHFFDTEPYLDDVNDPEENALMMAKEIAKEYVSDIDEYELIVGDPRISYKEKDGKTYQISYHMISFAKKINDYYTSDFISIKVTSKGNLASIYMGDIGAFQNANIELDKNLLQNSIANKVSDKYKSISYDVRTYSVEDQKLAVTPDGNVCVYSTVDVCIANTEDKTLDTRIAILTIAGEKIGS